MAELLVSFLADVAPYPRLSGGGQAGLTIGILFSILAAVFVIRARKKRGKDE